MAYSSLSDFFGSSYGQQGSAGTATAPPTAKTVNGTLIPVDAQKRIDAGKPWIADRLLLGEGNLRSMAGDIVGEEQRRYQSGRDLLTTQFNQSNAALSQGIDPDLLFSQASDAIGARAMTGLNNLRSSFGARGLSPNSGAAGGALSRLAYQQDAALTGATRDIAIDNQKQRAVNAAQMFANALNLSNFVNSPVSGAGLETEQNIFEGLLAQKGIAENRKSQKEANKTNKTGALIGAGASLLGGAVGLL